MLNHPKGCGYDAPTPLLRDSTFCVFDTSKIQGLKDSLPLSGYNSDVQLAFSRVFTTVDGDSQIPTLHTGRQKSFLLEQFMQEQFWVFFFFAQMSVDWYSKKKSLTIREHLLLSL